MSILGSFRWMDWNLMVTVVLKVVKESEISEFLFSVLKKYGFCSGVIDS